jgi:epoxyqueuosine reductase QueG
MAVDLAELVTRLSEVGLNHSGMVDVSTYNAGIQPALHTHTLAPWARSIVVFASGGPALWDALLSDLRQDPSHFTESTHPLDDFVKSSLEGVSDVFGGTEHRWIRASADADVHLDFRRLAVIAGLGSPSRLGLVIHPKFGPWMGLRAACFLPIELPASAQVADLCGDCPAPCVDACQGDAFVDGRWEVSRCADFHRRSSLCAVDCDSRLACPVGAEARYSVDERRYHNDRASGRIRMAQLLNIEDDSRQGVGPHWGDWSSPEEDSSLDD